MQGDRPDWCEACGKPIHRRWRAAERSAKATARRHPDRKGLHPYPCPEGHGFHLTTQRTIRQNKPVKTKRRQKKRPDRRDWTSGR